MSYLPEKTIKYKTYVKTALVEALQPVFTNHVDSKLQNTKVTIDMPKERQQYPSVVIRFYEQQIENAGVGHEEHLDTNRIQRVNIFNATGGTFKLKFNGEETEAIAFDASSSDVKSALSNLDKLNAEDIDVSGGDGGPYLITIYTSFVEDVDLITADRSGLEGIRPKILITCQTYKFKHSLYHGDIEFAIYALSSLDRDLIADTIVQTIRFGDLASYTNNFFNRIYPKDADAFPDSIGHYININSDQIQGVNETQSAVPWGAEDDLVYNSSYRTRIFGEFYSLPPDVPYQYISKILLYPYIEGVDPVPTIDQ